MTDLVAFAVRSLAGWRSLRATEARSLTDAGRDSVNSSVGRRYDFTALLRVHLIHYSPRSLGVFEELLDVLPKEIAPYPDDSVSSDSYVTKQNQNTKKRLLKSRQLVQIDCIQSGVRHGTRTKEDGVDIAKAEVCFSVATVAIDAAAVHDDR